MKENKAIVESFSSRMSDFSADAVSKLKMFFNNLLMDFTDSISPKTTVSNLIEVAKESLNQMDGQLSSQEYAALEDVINNNLIPKLKAGDIKKTKVFMRELSDGINVALGK